MMETIGVQLATEITMVKKGMTALLVFVAIAGATASGTTSEQVVMRSLWSGLPSDDERAGAYDYLTGLSSYIACTEGPGKHVLTVQFASSRPAPIRFYADLIAKDEHRAPKPTSAHTVSQKSPVWNYERVVKTCDDPYELYVGYPP